MLTGIQTGIAAIVAAALSASAALPATAAPLAKPADAVQVVQVKAGDSATDFSARRRYRRAYPVYPYAAPPAYYGYSGGYYAPAPRVYGNPYMYGTPYHGPRGPYAPPCARGSTC